MFSFEIGKQVVCSDGGDNGTWPGRDRNVYRGPVTGQVLTEKDIRKFRVSQDTTLLGLQFFEVKVSTQKGDAYFNSVCFRPVKDTNIKCFQRFIEPAPVL